MASTIDQMISDFVGTTRNFILINIARLKNNSGVMESRNEDDSAYAVFGAHTLNVHGSNASYKAQIKAAAGSAADVSITLPASAPVAGQALIATDGDGNTEWGSPASNAELTQSVAYTQATSSPATIFTPPADAIITQVINRVKTAAGGAGASVSVGVSGTVERDMDADESVMTAARVYTVSPMTEVGGTPGAMLLTITPGGQTFEGLLIVKYTNPA